MSVILCYFYVKIDKRLAGKLGRIILLHLGLVTFRCNHWKHFQTPHFHDFLIFGRVLKPQNQYDLYLETQYTSNKPRKSQIVFKTYVFG